MILIITQCFPSRLGGIESLLSNLALYLSKSNKVLVFADHHELVNDRLFDDSNKDFYSIKRFKGIKFLRSLRKAKEIKLLIESEKISLVISDSWKSLVKNIEYLNIKKIPVVCLAHGNELLSKNYSKIDKISKIISKTSMVIANSKFTKNLIYNLKIPNINLEYIYPGALDFRESKSVKIPNIKGGPILLTLGRIEKRKGHIFVIESIKKLKIKYPNINYVIAGDGKEKKNLQKIVLENKLSANIHFVGKVNEYQKKYLFEKTDLMIMPTLDESSKNSIEGFGIVYIEAAFFSIPSITTNVGGTSEAVLNNLTGTVINKIEDLNVSILELLENKEKRLNLGRFAKERAINEFHWNQIIKKHLSIYKKIC